MYRDSWLLGRPTGSGPHGISLALVFGVCCIFYLVVLKPPIFAAFVLFCFVFSLILPGFFQTIDTLFCFIFLSDLAKSFQSVDACFSFASSLCS